MKTKYLLSALAIGAAFVACNNEDIMVDETINTNEIVGAKLLGTGLSLNLINGEDLASRATATGWADGDVAGLGWVVAGDPGDGQGEVDLSTVGENLYANHFYQYSNKTWGTKSNIYEGWHFAYFPYKYQSKPGVLEFEVNGAVFEGGHYKADMANNAPHISAAALLNSDKIDETKGTITESFAVERVVNTLLPNLEITDDFTQDSLLKKIAINSITLGSTKNKPFFKTIKVVPSKLPENYYTEDGIYAEDSTLLSLRQNLYTNGALELPTTRVKSITTELKEGAFTLNQDQMLRIFLAPVHTTNTLDIDSLYFRIDVAGGHFDVAYTDGNEEDLTSVQLDNNVAIQKLYDLMMGQYEVGDSVYSFKTISTQGGNLNAAQRITMSLALENFHADYLIEDSTDWNGCVALANALCKEGEVPTFTLKKGANVIFTDTITAPKNGVKVTVAEGTGNLTVDGELNWNNAISFDNTKSVHVTVNKDAVLSVDNVLNPSWLYNNGTIKAGALSTISTESGRLTNSGLVIVEYGAYVYPNSGAVGKIAYVVPATNYFDKVATLVKKNNAEGQANVNTLIINEGVTLDCVKTTQTEGTGAVTDRYNPEDEKPGSSSSTALKLDGINIEINGGSIVTTEGYPVTVANVAMNGGSIENVKIASDLTAEGINEIITESIEGKVTISSGETTITGATFKKDVTVEGGKLTLVDCTIEGTLTNKGTVVLESEEFIHITNIVNNGTLIANNDVFVTNVTLNPKSVTTLTDKELTEMDWNKTIFYTNTYINDKMTLNGTVMKYSIPSFDPAATADEKGVSATAALESAAKDAVVYLPEGTYGFAKESDIELNGTSIICEPGTVINSSVNNAANRVFNYKISDVKSIVLKNFTLNAPLTKWDVYFRNDKMNENGVVDIIIENVTCNSMIFDFYYQNNTTANVKFVNCDIKTVRIHPNNPTSIINVEYDAASKMDISTEGNIYGGVANIVKK